MEYWNNGIMVNIVTGCGLRVTSLIFRKVKPGTRNTELGTGLFTLANMFVKDTSYQIRNGNGDFSEYLIMKPCNL
jgi:hypothetical protein